MKTKKILLPGMLATLMFAACTNEEIVKVQNEAPEVDLSNRPIVGMVDLDFGPQTRLVQGDDAFNQVVWSNGDKIGARIIDAPNGHNYKDPSMNYSAVDAYASSNYEYTKGKTDGIWRTEALLVEGHYMFYAPYNPSQSREALVLNFPYNQKIDKIEAGKVNEDAIANFFANTDNQTVLAGHKFIAANGDPKVKPFMEHIYAYPQITLKNAEEFIPIADGDTIETALNITKIIIKSAEIKDKYQVSHAKLISMMKDAVAKNSDKGYEKVEENISAGRWQSPLALLRDGKTSDILLDIPTVEVKGKNLIISLENTYTAANEEAVKFHAVLPALVYGKDDLTVNVVFEDEDGTEWTFVNDLKFEAASMTLAPGKRYPREEYDFSDSYKNADGSVKGYATKATAGQLATFVIPEKNLLVKKYEADKPIVNIKYARELGEWLAENIDNNTVTVIEGTDFELEKYKGLTGNQAYLNDKPMLEFNDSLIDVVNQYLDKGKVTFTSQMLVSEDLTPSKDRFAFNGGVYQTAGTLTLDNVTLGASIFKGTVTLKNITASGKNMDFQGKATVNGGKFGDLTFAAGKTATIQNEVKAVTVTLNNGATEIGKLEANATNINGGTVTVPDKFEGDLGTVTAKNATLNVAEVIDNVITLGYEGTGNSAGNYYGNVTLNVTAADFDFAKVKANCATINLNADTKMKQAFVNNWKSGAITNASGKKLTLGDAVTIPAKSIKDKNVKRTFTNNGTVVGTLNIAAGAEVTNNYELEVNDNEGKIITGEDSRTYVTSGAGEVDNSSLSYVKANAEQTVSATFNESKTVEEIETAGPGLRYINKLIFANGLTLERAFASELLNNVASIEIQGGDVVVKAFVGSSIKNVDITGDVTFRGTLDRENTGFGFKNGADIKITEGKTMTVAYMTMATLDAANGLNFTGEVIVKDADLYIGLGSVTNYKLQLDGQILNAWYDWSIKATVSVKQAAFQAAVEKGGKVVIFEDMAIPATVTISKETEIDLNGHTLLSVAGDVINVNGAKLTIGGGTVKATQPDAEAIKNFGGTLIIKDGTYEATGTGNCAAIVCDAPVAGTTWSLTINGGTFKSTNFTAVSLQNNRLPEGSAIAEGLADIKAGTFQGGGSYYDLYLENVNANVTTSACEFKTNKVWIHLADGNSVINGKLVTSTTHTEGLIPVDGDNLKWNDIYE